MTEKTTKKLMLIDGHSMAFRAFYALNPQGFSTLGGQHTNAVWGFLSMIIRLFDQEKPSHVAVAFDVGRTTFRTKRFPAYKAQRPPSPPEFAGQVEILKNILPALGIKTLEKENFEADDIIATLATEATAGGFETLIVTGDRDSLQLVNDLTTVLYPVKGVSEMNRFTPALVEEKYGLTPTQYPDMAAIRGDQSDNLPNIPGVGPKTATKWIAKYGSLEKLIAHADELTGKVGEKFRASIEQVRLNRELTEMVKDLSLPEKPDTLAVGDFDAVAVNERFDEIQFGTSLRDKVFACFGVGLAEFLDEPGKSGSHDLPDLKVKESIALSAFLSKERKTGGIGVCVTGCAAPGAGSATIIGLAAVDRQAAAWKLDELSQEDDDALADWLADKKAPKCFHGAKASWHMLHGQGYEIEGLIHDTAIAGYLLRPGQRRYELADVYMRHLQKPLQSALDAESSDSGKKSTSSGKGEQLSLLDGDEQTSLLHCAVDAAAILELAGILSEELTKISAYSLYTDLELKLVPILARMEDAGIAVNVDRLVEQQSDFEQKVLAEEQAARLIAEDPELNLSSPKQLQAVLFDKLEMPKTKKTKTGYSTAAKEIEALSVTHPHPFLDHLLAHREYQKMKVTLDGLIKAVGDDGRIHTTFNQTVASTGRLSSTDPNLQNIPVRTEDGKKIREAFIVGPGYETLLTADYSQIEMRVMAHLSGDLGLIDAYQRGEDLHNYVGSKVFDVPVSSVTPELRRRVKAMSYGLVYGLSAFGLSQQLGISGSEAKQIMETYFERFGGVKKYLEEVVEKARQDGYTETLFGRRRYLPELVSTNRVARENAERAALNAPIQGTAADIIKVAMIRVDEALKKAKMTSRLLLQIHDELVVEVAPGELEDVSLLLSEQMDGAIRLDVPLDISAGHGTNWDTAAH